jgi:hypothetical protein
LPVDESSAAGRYSPGTVPSVKKFSDLQGGNSFCEKEKERAPLASLSGDAE